MDVLPRPLVEQIRAIIREMHSAWGYTEPHDGTVGATGATGETGPAGSGGPHDDLTNVTAGQHHDNATDHANALIAHNINDAAHDTGATGAELDTLTDASDADALHTHPAHAAAGDPHAGYRLESADHTHASAGAQAGKISHDSALDDVSADDHHAQTHAPESHSGTGITGAELEDLSDGGETALHSHAGGGGHTIKDEGGAGLTARTNLDFVGAGVVATDGGAGPDSTIVTISGGGAGVDETDLWLAHIQGF